MSDGGWPYLAPGAPDAAPLVIEHRRKEEGQGRFTPEARLHVTSAFRTSGLLQALPPEEAKLFLLLLTFLTPNGRIQPTVQEIAGALDVPESEARRRMQGLVAFAWQGEPLVREVARESGMDGYVLSSAVVAEMEEAPEPKPELPSSWRAAGREAVIAHSRARYGRPRAEVEREVLRQLGYAPEEQDNTPEGEARRRLLALGVLREQVELLLLHYPVEEILQQLDWLPYRHAKSPARLVVAAIEGRYDPPARVRLEMEIAAEEAARAVARDDAREGSAVIAAPANGAGWDGVSLALPEGEGEGATVPRESGDGITIDGDGATR